MMIIGDLRYILIIVLEMEHNNSWWQTTNVDFKK